jgi:regulatory protein
MEITYNKFKKQKISVYKPAPTLENARNYALYLLSRQMYTAAIIGDKLQQKDYSAKDTELVVQEMKKLGYINDNNYADVYFRNLISHGKYGYFGIKQRLQRKKLPEEEIVRVMSALDAIVETNIALKFVEAQTNISSQKRSIEKLVRMMQNRGFRWEAISEVLKKFKNKFKKIEEDF